MRRGIFWLRWAENANDGVRAPRVQNAEPLPTDIEMMRRALALGAAAVCLGEVPVGAVIYRVNKSGEAEILGEGSNRRETDGDPAAHAEVLAIRAAAKTLGDWRLTGCSLAVTLEPCPMCAGAIVNARVSRLVYGAPDPKAGAVRSLMRLADDPRLNHRAIIVPGVLANEAAAQLREFFKAVRAKRKGS